MTLFELNKAIEEVIERGYSVNEETGELIACFDDLDQLKENKEEKIKNCAMYIREQEIFSDDIDKQIDILKKRKETAKKKADYLKQYLMENTDHQKYEFPEISITYRTSTSTEVNEELLPKKYLHKVVTYKADKNELKQLLKDGATIKGAQLVIKTNLIIK